MIPCFHWPSASIQEFTWNSKSWPEGLPRKKNGRTTANAVVMMISSDQGTSGLNAENAPQAPVELAAAWFSVSVRFKVLFSGPEPFPAALTRYCGAASENTANGAGALLLLGYTLRFRILRRRAQR